MYNMKITVYDLLMMIDIRDHYTCVHICSDDVCGTIWKIHDYDEVDSIPEFIREARVISFYNYNDTYTFMI